MSSLINKEVSSQSEQSVDGKTLSYRICNTIDFFPEELLLRNTNTGKEASLFAPASKCLEALIEHQGQIISQQELMYIGWESTGTKVTQNAYYQNIASIRRCLKDTSEDDTDMSFIITTIKRSGLTINADIEIIPKYLETSEEINVVVDNNVSVEIKDKFKSLNYNIYIIGISLSIFILSLLLHSKFFMTKSFFENYTFIKHIPNECDVFLNIDANKKIFQESIYYNKNLHCDGYSQAFITIYPNHSRSSILFCSKSNKQLTCTSNYYSSNSK